jgi:hypothetical protein
MLGRLDLKPREPPAMSRMATAACGLLLGCVMELLQTVQQPIAQVSLAQILDFVSQSLPMWCGCALAWAFCARTMEPRVGLPGLGAVWLAMTAALTGSAMLVNTAPPIGGSGKPSLESFAAHATWTNAFYGGLYLAAYAGWRRSIRSARALARMRQARDESAALLQQGRVESFRRALQPQTILQSVGALRRLYGADPVAGDALLETLVGFLRAAVRSLNAGSSTFPEEIDLACRYLQLRKRAGGGVGALLIGHGPAPPDLPFPPRLLMPVLEAVCLAGGDVSLRTGWREGVYGFDLTVRGAGPDALPTALKRRIAAQGQQPGYSCRLLEDGRYLFWSLRIDRSPAPATRDLTTTSLGASS